MFSGLSSYIKKLLPKRLFYRALLIVATPIIILQIIISIVFFDSLWIKTNKGMTRALIGEIKFFIDAYENEEYEKGNLIRLFKEHHNFNVKFQTFGDIPETDMERWFSPMDRTLRRELKNKFKNYWFDTTTYKELIELKIEYLNGYFEFLIPKNRVTNTSARLFALWITFPAFLLITIALIFLKNQTRPIINLAKASEKFGRGEDVEEFRPSGALEIRQAGFEFERMRKRILRHLNQRSEMLSGISHDLRTPLTRLKLQLAMLKQKDISEKMSKDIDEMEKMLNDYLQFAKTQSQESTASVNLNKLFNLIKKEFDNANISYNDNNVHVEMEGRPTALKRSFENIIQNALTYGKDVFINVQKGNKKVIIMIEDNGPGIPEDQYKNVFKPFFRLDQSRSLNKSGVGLGLAIVEDIINSHGGNVQLGKSKYNGLLVKISLPL